MKQNLSLLSLILFLENFSATGLYFSVQMAKIRWQKVSENQASYRSSDEYYLSLDGEFRKITNEKAIYGLLQEHQSDLKKFIKEKKFVIIKILNVH